MPTISSVGQSFALDGREACIQAIEEAKQKILHEADHIVMAFIFASREYNLQSVLSGASAQLRTTPLFGFSTEGQIQGNGEHQRSIVVALLAGDDFTVQANWWGDIFHYPQTKLQEMLESFVPSVGKTENFLLIHMDGMHGEHETLCKILSAGHYRTFGTLTGHNDRQKSAFQIGGLTGGDHGLSIAALQGNLKASVGVAHGWQRVGKYFELTRTEDLWVRQLNDRPAAETYASLFGQQMRDWAFPPLNRLVRLYPLGLEDGEHLTVKSPLFVEVDGSLRMTTHVPQGKIGHVLVGSVQKSLEAARQAAQQALTGLGSARPILALVFADIAWKMLFETQPGQELSPIREVLGPNVPIAGGYTLGQIYTNSTNVEVLNQHIEIILLGAVD
ncbi:MAG TPA: FIST N-terminal domain-containing protein [Anaerolineales bacterium]|nr:FIST N-terminal domain-containing protein [Anaerolineales bacterium]